MVGIAASKNPGGAKTWVCNHCKLQFTSSYTRIHVHFFGAEPGKKGQIRRCPAMLKDKVKFQELKARVAQAEKDGISLSLKNSVIQKRHKPTVKKPIQDCFGVMERDAVDLKVIRGLCANGIPFNVLRNPATVEMFNAVQKAPAGYKLPSTEKARTTLLDECKRSVDKELIPLKDTWYTQGVSVVSDGWTNVRHKPLINFIASNSRGSVFLYAEDFSGVEKTGVAIAEYLLKGIREIGPSNVLQVVTDNASNCKAAGREIEKVYKHIFWSPCVVHTLNLMFKDFTNNFEWLKTTYKRGKEIVKYFVNHQQSLAIFRAHSRLELLKVAKTRFASHYIMLNRLLKCRESLATVVVLKSWKEWVKSGDERTRMMGELVSQTIREDAFWDEVENIVKITKPIYLVIKFADGEGSKVAEIYERMDNMLGEIKDIVLENDHASDFDQMEKIVLERWEKMNVPVHCLGFALNPRFYDPHYLQLPAPGGTTRKAPNLDREVVRGVMTAISKISEDSNEEKKLREQFATFHMKKGLFAMSAAQADALTMDPIDWWSSYGSETPELAEVALKVLSQPISASSAERVWSTYSYIHNVKRNRLNGDRADKLVYIHCNIRLASRASEQYNAGSNGFWNVDPENSNLVQVMNQNEEDGDE